jgi:hypothetical protein
MLIGWEEYHYFINCTINEFLKTNKMTEMYLNTSEIALEELNKITK